MWAFCSHFKMRYVSGRILIWNYRFEHTISLKLDLSLKLTYRKVDGNTDRAESQTLVPMQQCLWCERVRKRWTKTERLWTLNTCVYLTKKRPLLRTFPWNLFPGIMFIWEVRLTLPGRRIFPLMREINYFNHSAVEGRITVNAKGKNCPSSEIYNDV